MHSLSVMLRDKYYNDKTDDGVVTRVNLLWEGKLQNRRPRAEVFITVQIIINVTNVTINIK